MSKIEFTKEDLENVANLARLKLTEEEKSKFLVEMQEVLEYVGQVSEMASEDIEASGGESYGERFKNSANKDRVREDNVLTEANEYTEALLENAPIRNGDYVEVSQVLNKHKNK